MSPVVAVRFGIVALLALAWEAVGRSGLILHDVFPPASEVMGGVVSVLASPQTAANTMVTAAEIGTGFAIGAGAGLGAGIGLGASARAYGLLDPFLYYLGAIPKIIVYPILILLWGAGMGSKVGIAALSAFFPVAINTAVAARQVRPVLIRAAHALGARPHQVLINVSLPAMAGDVLSGLRVGLAVAATGTLLAETSVAQAGLGLQAIHYYAQLRVPEMYALLSMVFLAATLINAGLGWLISRWTRYRHGGQTVPIP